MAAITNRRPARWKMNREHSLTGGNMFFAGGIGHGGDHFHDSSSDPNHGTLTGFTGAGDTPAGRWGRDNGRAMLSFDGTNDYVNVTPRTFTFGQSWTIACLANFSNSAAYHSLFGASATSTRLALDIGGAGFYFAGDANNYQLFTSLPVTAVAQWHNYAVVGSTKTIWIDGKLTYTYTGADTLFTLSHWGRGYSAYYMAGSMADCGAWNRDLSASELKTLANLADPMYGDWLQAVTRPTYFLPLAGGLAFDPATSIIDQLVSQPVRRRKVAVPY